LGVNFIGGARIRYLGPMAQYPPDQPESPRCQAMMLVLPYLKHIPIAPVGAKVSSFSIRAERLTISRQRPW
jgi:hypothetical protein